MSRRTNILVPIVRGRVEHWRALPDAAAKAVDFADHIALKDVANALRPFVAGPLSRNQVRDLTQVANGLLAEARAEARVSGMTDLYDVLHSTIEQHTAADP